MQNKPGKSLHVETMAPQEPVKAESQKNIEQEQFAPGRLSEASTIHWLTPDQHAEWDAFVLRHPLGLVYHTSSWHKLLENTFKHIRGRFLVLRDGEGQIQAGLPVYTVSSWLLKNRNVSVPFATMCDPLISTKEEFNMLWPAIEEECGGHRSQRIEIRTRRFSAENLPDALTANGKYKHHFLPLEGNTDALFKSFHQSCVRRRVEKARKTAITIEEREDEQSLRVFHSMLAVTRQRHSLPPMPFAFFQQMYSCLRPNNVSLYFAVHEGKPVGGLMALKFKDMWTMEYNGDADNPPPGANQLLCWETIQRAKSSGARFYSFGRTSLDNANLIEYKGRWATIEEDLTDYVHLRDAKAGQAAESTSAASHALRAAAMRMMQYAPAVVQKSVGDFCYRHLG
jgi:hypothetical protein